MERFNQNHDTEPASNGRGKSAASSPLVLGFIGLGGRNEARRTIPSRLFHCPGLLLLHDPIYIPEELFNVDSNDTLETTQYRLALRLVDKGIIKILPGSNQVFTKNLQIEHEHLIGVLLRRFECDVPADVIMEWAHHGIIDKMIGHCPAKERTFVRAMAELLLDVCKTQAISEQQKCPYAFPREDAAIIGLRWELSERSVDNQVHALLHAPIPRGSILVTDAGKPGDILPELAYTAKSAGLEEIYRIDKNNNQIPYVEPSWDRSSEFLERVAEAREEEPVKALRKVFADWYQTVRELNIPEQSVFEQLASSFQKRVTDLSPRLDPVYQQLGKAIGNEQMMAVLSVPQEVPAPPALAGSMNSATESKPVLLYPEYYGTIDI
jgi:hypothetical protein